ncbi:PspC domain-containing protein [Aquipuribacter sp. SD81]|uniref:PspC domain-containing protein n=1 Tax=Aquipuribacter sp. SD81 TaxID=3127703 RepID=UPI003016B8AD
MRRTGIRRPTDDRWLGGVCAGTARRLGVDPLLLRVALVGLTVLGGVGVIAYALALVLLPDADGRIELERASHGDLTGTTVGAVALLLLGLVSPGPWDLLRGGPLVDGGDLVGAVVVGTLLLIGLSLLPRLAGASAATGATTDAASEATAPWNEAYGTSASGATGYGTTGWSGQGYEATGSVSTRYGTYPYATTAAGTTYGSPTSGDPTDPGTGAGTPVPPHRPTPGPPAYRPKPPQRPGPGAAVSSALVGLALLVAGGLWFATEADLLPGRPAVVALAGAATLLGAAIVVLGLAGRRDGGVGGAAFLVVVLAGAVLVVPSWRTTQLVGEAVWQPESVAAAERGGSIGLGSGVLDLGALTEPTTGTVRIPVRSGIGNLEVLVPEGLDVRIEAGALVGAVRDERDDVVEDGVGVERTLAGDDPVVVVDARVLVGEVVVSGVPR